MKKKKTQLDDLLPEYDLSNLKGGVRGKYVRRFKKGRISCCLPPMWPRYFPNGEAVNAALVID